MDDPLAVNRALHVLLVDVINRKITRDSSEQIDIGFGDRFGESHLFPE